MACCVVLTYFTAWSGEPISQMVTLRLRELTCSKSQCWAAMGTGSQLCLSGQHSTSGTVPFQSCLLVCIAPLPQARLRAQHPMCTLSSDTPTPREARTQIIVS